MLVDMAQRVGLQKAQLGAVSRPGMHKGCRPRRWKRAALGACMPQGFAVPTRG